MIFILLQLIIADLVLGGDNAIVIALATKKLDPQMKKKASLIGALLAIILRVILVVIIMFIGEKHIYFLNIIAGMMLVYIALELISNKEEEHSIKSENTLHKAVKTIVLADFIMSLDNAIIIATIAASSGYAFEYQIAIVIIGLLVSFPIILFGARILSVLIEKFKWIVYLFSFILIHAALEMIIKDHILYSFHTFLESKAISIALWLIAIATILIAYMVGKNKSK